ncbi:hypothetical protein PCASD_13374 [Puccinia coronata f. sp. avenae]|uniref:Uncharacterized protein n=1 Tax=Puccinia coronata f. sp. avenae TaxID=200324 RepID=A0A2N5TZ53_9BASI|nr:hypothetical protein PCASD_13374 [Puccinia coronata f. sp. avenae]
MSDEDEQLLTLTQVKLAKNNCEFLNKEGCLALEENQVPDLLEQESTETEPVHPNLLEIFASKKKPDWDEDTLLEENEKLRENVRMQQQKQRKLLAREKTLEEQLEYSEEQRTLLQNELDTVTDDYNKANMLLRQTLAKESERQEALSQSLLYDLQVENGELQRIIREQKMLNSELNLVIEKLREVREDEFQRPLSHTILEKHLVAKRHTEDICWFNYGNVDTLSLARLLPELV